MSQPLREALLKALCLKDLSRAGWVRAGVHSPESVAAHSWGVAWLVLVLCPPSLDRGRALAIAIIHDLSEVKVGDITPHDGVPPQVKAQAELQAFRELTQALPPHLLPLFQDYGESPEGRFVRACDKLDMALQATRYRRDQDLDLQEFVDSALARLSPGPLRDLVG